MRRRAARTALGERSQVVLEGPEVARKPGGRSGGSPGPVAQRLSTAGPARSSASQQVKQDRQLGAVLELTAQQGERVGVQRGAQLLLGEPEQVP